MCSKATCGSDNNFVVVVDMRRQTQKSEKSLAFVNVVSLATKTQKKISLHIAYTQMACNFVDYEQQQNVTDLSGDE